MSNRFVNPYHFVEIGDKCSKKSINEYPSKKGITGWIEYSVKTLTPVFITNVTNNKAFQKRFNVSNMHSYDFFSYEDLSGIQEGPVEPKAPVLPGSEIRGVIRSAFEAVTNSCLSVVDEDERIFRRPVEVKAGKPGILKKKGDKWYLYECERYGIKVKDNNKDKNRNFKSELKKYKWEHEIWFKEGGTYEKYIKKNKSNKVLFKLVSDISKTEKNGYEKGYLHKGEDFVKKHHDSIFCILNKNDNSIEIPKEVVENFKYSLKLYADSKINKHLKKGHNGYKHINPKDDFFLVYYHKVCDSLYYISPAAMGREVYKKRLKDILDTYSPCSSENCICPACKLFGFVSENGKNSKALASKVRFGDAEFVKTNSSLFHKPIVLNELSSPKISASEFYLKKPNEKAEYWTYDYVKSKHQNKKYVLNNPKILGRKFYWHQKIKKVEEAKEKSERNVGIRPLNAQAEFKGKIYFNKITEKELNTLIWVLTIGNSEEHAHKIGMGKPLGLGSIRFYCDSVKIRTLNAEGNNIKHAIEDRNYDINSIENELRNNPGFEDFLKLTNFEKAPTPVQYPSNNQNKEHYKWFANNKKGGKFHQNLTEVNVKYPYLKKNNNENNKKR